MTTLAHWLPDIGIGGLVFASLSLFGGVIFIVLSKQVLKRIRLGQPQHGREYVGTIAWFGFSLILGYSFASNLRRDHWLRVGTPRYTIATVARSYYSRSGRKFTFTYQVDNTQHESRDECGRYACPPPGTRRYVRFAAEAPDVSQLVDQPVPDSVQLIPSQGWVRLP